MIHDILYGSPVDHTSARATALRWGMSLYSHRRIIAASLVGSLVAGAAGPAAATLPCGAPAAEQPLQFVDAWRPYVYVKEPAPESPCENDHWPPDLPSSFMTGTSVTASSGVYFRTYAD